MPSQAALAPNTSTIELESPAATGRLAARIAALARPGDVIALSGPLGAGKTEFARFFIAALAALEGRAAEEVPSPTFTLVQSYAFARFTVFHFDLYRMADADEVWELGFEEALAEGVSLIEWPERMGALIPEDRLDIALALGAGPESRIATIVARGSWAARLAEAELAR